MAQHSEITILDTPTTNIDSDNNTTHTFSYTLPAGTNNRLVMFCIGQEDNTLSATDPISITFNGDAATLFAGSAEDNDAADDPGSKIYGYRPGSLAAGSYTVLITYNAAILNSLAVVFTLDHTFFSSDVAVVGNNGANGTSVSDSITPITDRAMAIQCTTNQDTGALSVTSGQTVLFNSTWGTNAAATLVAYKIVETPGAQVMGANFAGTADWANVIVAVKPARRRIRVS
jgi:hypothetical protein